MNRKIRLELESLDVESFETSAELEERGTVRGNACSDSTCFQNICTCTDEFGNCVASNVNCNSGGTGTGGGTGITCTRVNTCATAFQQICSCYN
jgi:hypothetical protein